MKIIKPRYGCRLYLADECRVGKGKVWKCGYEEGISYTTTSDWIKFEGEWLLVAVHRSTHWCPSGQFGSGFLDHTGWFYWDNNNWRTNLIIGIQCTPNAWHLFCKRWL